MIRKLKVKRVMIKGSKPFIRVLFSKGKNKIDFNKDYYGILGVDSKSSFKVIRSSYLKLAK